MIKIYGMFTPNYLKVVMAAEELGVNYQIVPVDLTKGEARGPENRSRHPFGKVPVIEHDGRFVFESNAILRYLGNVKETKLYPQEAYARSQVDQWLDYFSLQAGRWCTNVWFQKVIAPEFFKEEPDQKMIDEFTEYLFNDLPVIDAHLGKNKFLTGSTFTIADVNAYSLMMGYPRAGLDCSKFKNFERWFMEVKARPSMVKVEGMAAGN